MRRALALFLSLALILSSTPCPAGESPFSTDEFPTENRKDLTFKRSSRDKEEAPAEHKKKRIKPFGASPKKAPAKKTPAAAVKGVVAPAEKTKEKKAAPPKTTAPAPAKSPEPAKAAEQEERPADDEETPAGPTAPPPVNNWIEEPAAPAETPAPAPPAAAPAPAEPTPAPAPAAARPAGPDKAATAALEKDLSYYRRTSDKKKWAPNDRLYVLYRLKEKYAQKRVDLSALLAEVDKWEQAKRAPAAAPRPAAQDPAAEPPPAGPTAEALQELKLPSWEDYVLQNGDLLDIRVAPASELDRELAVQPDGTISFPLIGAIRAEGLTRAALQRSITQKLGAYVIEPDVTVTVRRFAGDAVIVTGRVNSPGAVTHKEGMIAADAVTAAGGFQSDADRSGVFIFRGREDRRETFLVDADLPRGDPKALPLHPGDIVDVQQARDVSILGMVSKPGHYPFRKDLSLLDLVFESGGLSAGARAGSVFLYSQSDAGRKSRRINLNRIMTRSPNDDPKLRPGDIVMVPQRPFYGVGGGSPSTVLTTLFYISTIVIAVVLATDK